LNHLGGRENMTFEEWKTLMGVLPGGPKLPRKILTDRVALPDSFDARTHWVFKICIQKLKCMFQWITFFFSQPNCDTIKAIRDQRLIVHLLF
jgi:hypothetical protein